MIKKLYDRCVTWAGHRYAKPILAIEAFIESSFFPIPPDVMIIPMVISKKNEFVKIALIATIFSVLGALFGYYIGYSLNEIAIKIFEIYGYEYSDSFKEKFTAGGGFFAWLGILVTAGYRFGQKIGPFLDKQGTKWSIIIAVIIISMAAGIYFLYLK